MCFLLLVGLLAAAADGELSAEQLTPAALQQQRGKLVPLERHGLKFELFLPLSWQPPSAGDDGSATNLPPVLIFLHGRGESGAFEVTNAQSLPLQLLTNHTFTERFPFIVVVPQCPTKCMMQNHWLSSTLQGVTALVREWVLHQPDGSGVGGDRSRVYLAGQSMGGHGAWIYAAQQPRLFAAVVVVCGYMQGSRETRTITERLARTRLPVAVYHSADDVVIPVFASDKAVAALRALGYEGGSGGTDDIRPLRYVRYDHAPGPPIEEFANLVGHGSYELAFRDGELYTWLLSQRCTRCAARPHVAWHALDAGGGHGEVERRV